MNCWKCIKNIKEKSNICFIQFLFMVMEHSVWKSPKSRIQHCERSELRLHFEWTKVCFKMSRKPLTLQFLKLAVKQCYQASQFWYAENCRKMPKFKCTLLDDFQTTCPCCHILCQIRDYLRLEKVAREWKIIKVRYCKRESK